MHPSLHAAQAPSREKLCETPHRTLAQCQHSFRPTPNKVSVKKGMERYDKKIDTRALSPRKRGNCPLPFHVTNRTLNSWAGGEPDPQMRFDDLTSLLLHDPPSPPARERKLQETKHNIIPTDLSLLLYYYVFFR